MSTRKANFITLDELIDEVGIDAVRYFFIMRNMNSHLNFDLKLAKGDFTVMMGPSGSGKSTLLNIIGGLDRATSGKAIINEQDVGSLSNKALSLMRLNNIGFVFQNYNLIPVLTAYENAEYVLMLQGIPPFRRREKVMNLLQVIG